MYDIKIGRFDEDPSCQGVIRPADDSWQLVIDGEGFPRLYVRAKLEDPEPGEPKTGFIPVEVFMTDSIPDIMRSAFGGKLTPEEEAEAHAQIEAEREAGRLPPCPR